MEKYLEQGGGAEANNGKRDSQSAISELNSDVEHSRRTSLASYVKKSNETGKNKATSGTPPKKINTMYMSGAGGQKGDSGASPKHKQEKQVSFHNSKK